MIAKGFADTASKQDIVRIETRLDGVEDRLTIVENKLDKALYYEFQKVGKLERQMKVVYEKLQLSAES